MNDLALADGIEYVFQNGEWTILTIIDNGKTIPTRYKTKDWETGWNDKYGCDVLTFEERLYQGLTNVMYPPEKDDDIDYEKIKAV